MSAAELAARRTVALSTAGDFQAAREGHSAGGPAPDWQMWALRLAGAVALVAESPDGDRDDDGDGTEPYCRACGEWAGLFIGVDGWRHFRGDPLPGGDRQLYDAGHPPVIGWARLSAAAISPAGLKIVRAALADAIGARMKHAQDSAGQATTDAARTVDHAQADAYRALAQLLGRTR